MMRLVATLVEEEVDKEWQRVAGACATEAFQNEQDRTVNNFQANSLISKINIIFIFSICTYDSMYI